MIRFALFMAGVVAASASTAGRASTCPVDAVPIEIAREKGGAPGTLIVEGKPIETRRNFFSFSTATMAHVAKRLSINEFCPIAAGSKERSSFQIAEWGLVNWTGEPLKQMPPLDVLPPGSCRLTSPWVDIAIRRTPRPSVRGVVRWNAHQLLVDQAVLAGALQATSGVAIPLKRGEFERFIKIYEIAEIRHEPTDQPIDQRIPGELLWLFRQAMEPATQDSFLMHTQRTMDAAMNKGADSYTQLVIALIDQCLDSGKTDIHYNSVLDVADLISLEKYKITTPID